MRSIRSALCQSGSPAFRAERSPAPARGPSIVSGHYALIGGPAMTRFNDYVHRYPHVALERTDSGVLTMRIHRDGGPAKWAALEGSIHEQIGDALWHAGRD